MSSDEVSVWERATPDSLKKAIAKSDEALYTFWMEHSFPHWSNIVESHGKYYLVDTCYTELGWETMIFRTKQGEVTDHREDVDGNKVNWHDLYAEWQKTKEEAETRHKEIVQNIGLYLPAEKRRCTT